MLVAKLFDRKTSENVMSMRVDSLEQLKYMIVTIFKEPESLLIIVEGMNPFLFVNFEHVLQSKP